MKRIKKTKLTYLVEAMDTLSIGAVLNKESFITAHWNVCDFWTCRSFDVYLYKAKKLLKPKQFLTKINKEIKRLADYESK